MFKLDAAPFLDEIMLLASLLVILLRCTRHFGLADVQFTVSPRSLNLRGVDLCLAPQQIFYTIGFVGLDYNCTTELICDTAKGAVVLLDKNNFSFVGEFHHFISRATRLKLRVRLKSSESQRTDYAFQLPIRMPSHLFAAQNLTAVNWKTSAGDRVGVDFLAKLTFQCAQGWKGDLCDTREQISGKAANSKIASIPENCDGSRKFEKKPNIRVFSPRMATWNTSVFRLRDCTNKFNTTLACSVLLGISLLLFSFSAYRVMPTVAEN